MNALELINFGSSLLKEKKISTHILDSELLLSKILKKKKIDHIKIREPGGSLNSEKIRKLILNEKSKFNKITDLLLYLSTNLSIKITFLL